MVIAENNGQVFQELAICINLRMGNLLPSCGARGSRDVSDLLETAFEQSNIELSLKQMHCMGQCHAGPTLRLLPGGPYFLGVKPDQVAEFFNHLQNKEYDLMQQKWPGPSKMME